MASLVMLNNITKANSFLKALNSHTILAKCRVVIMHNLCVETQIVHYQKLILHAIVFCAMVH